MSNEIINIDLLRPVVVKSEDRLVKTFINKQTFIKNFVQVNIYDIFVAVFVSHRIMTRAPLYRQGFVSDTLTIILTLN